MLLGASNRVTMSAILGVSPVGPVSPVGGLAAAWELSRGP